MLGTTLSVNLCSNTQIYEYEILLETGFNANMNANHVLCILESKGGGDEEMDLDFFDEEEFVLTQPMQMHDAGRSPGVFLKAT